MSPFDVLNARDPEELAELLATRRPRRRPLRALLARLRGGVR